MSMEKNNTDEQKSISLTQERKEMAKTPPWQTRKNKK